MTTKTNKESDYKTTHPKINMQYVYIFLVLIAWGIVPWLAKSVDLPGGTTAMIVNWSALVSVFVIMLFVGKLSQFAQLKFYWKQFVLLSFVWPLVYSIAFFDSIKQGSASLTTLLNYSWPLFAAMLLWIRGVKVSLWAMFSLSMSVLILGVALYFDGTLVVASIPAVVLGLVAAFAQGFFNVEGENNERYPSDLTWLLTFVGALVTAVGATVYVQFTETSIDISALELSTVWPLIVIGAFSNGIGFWAFLKAIKMSETKKQKINFWFGMMFVPVVQVALLPLVGIEEIGWWRVIALAGICINFLVYKYWEVNNS